MSGSNMFIMYSASDSNVTVSPRLGTGYSMPQFNGDAQISVLEGSGITADGGMVANVRCDNCLSWNGGSMDATSSSASWIWGVKSGSALNSASTSESISIHDSNGEFNLDLTQGTGGSSSNPFISSSTPSGGASPSASGSSGTQPVASALPSSSGSSSSSSTGSSGRGNNNDNVRSSHAIIMSLVFLVIFPGAALTLYLPYAQKVRYVHAPLQVLALILSIVGLALGVVLGQRVRQLDGYHQIIGYLVIGVLILFQPALGIMQHLHYRKTGGKSVMGVGHRWLGRSMIILGIINGGLGFVQSGPIGSTYVPSYAVVAYSIVAGVVGFIYVSVLLATSFRSKHSKQPRVGEKYRPDRDHGGYQMQDSPQSDEHRFHSQSKRSNSQSQRNNTYTISHPQQQYVSQQYASQQYASQQSYAPQQPYAPQQQYAPPPQYGRQQYR